MTDACVRATSLRGLKPPVRTGIRYISYRYETISVATPKHGA
jgi:hypothetical protein